MSKLQFTSQENELNITLNFSGQIDETFPPQLNNFKCDKKLIVNLENLKMINSLGIREWIKFVNSIEAKSIDLENCPKVFIDQVNMVQGFITAKCSIKSFYVPYFNEDENLEKNILYQSGHDYGEGFLNVKPNLILDDGVELEIDVIEQKYFKFLKNH